MSDNTPDYLPTADGNVLCLKCLNDVLSCLCPLKQRTRKHEIVSGARCPRCIYLVDQCICPEVVPVGETTVLTFHGEGVKVELRLRQNYNELVLTAVKGTAPFLREEFTVATFHHADNSMLVKIIAPTMGYTGDLTFTNLTFDGSFDERSWGDNYDDTTNTSVFL